MTETYYKFLNEDGSSPHIGFDWHLPRKKRSGEWQPGKWMPKVIAKPVECEVGYHAVERAHVLDWLAPRLYAVELAGTVVNGNQKVAAQRARLLRQEERWNDQTARLFAADCAAFALKFVQQPDPRSIAAIDVARRFALGDATESELAAAGDAARTAAGDAARTAAGDAARTAAWDAARTAAWAAARTAAGDAARTAAWDAAGAVLTLRFWEYVDKPELPEPWAIGFDAIAAYKEHTGAGQ